MTLWYITRATGVVALVLLTLTVTLGLVNAARVHFKRVPRFAINQVHRNASLLAVSFVAAHILTVLADTYVSIGVRSVLIPFMSGYRPLWVGLGTVSLDLLLAVIVTSLLRRRIGNRLWRATHWLAYGSWPVAVMHAIGTGTDARSRWMLAITVACVWSVLAALWVRVGRRSGKPKGSARQRPEGTRDRRPRPAAALNLEAGYE